MRENPGPSVKVGEVEGARPLNKRGRRFVAVKLSATALAAAAVAFVVLNGCHAVRNAPMVTRFPLMEPDTVTYIGHATVLFRLNGVTALTDPLYNERISIYRRYVQPGLPLQELPPLDLILISHSHWDHFDTWTLRRLDRRAVVVVPDGLQGDVRSLGFQDVRGLKHWETTTVGGAEVTAVPARHWGTYCGFLIHNGKTVYFAGDTGLFDGMREIGARRRIDLALLPIGAYRPHVAFLPILSRKMRSVHMAPEDVPPAAEMLGARLVVPVHWGTFKLTGEPIDEPLDRLQRVMRDESMNGRIRIVMQGETVAF